MQNVPVYIVSLKGATERRALIHEHLRGLGIDYEFIDAVRGDALDPTYRKEVALILEDDTVLHYSVKALVDSGCQSLDFDYCLLGSDDIGDEGYVFYDSGKPVSLSSQHEAYFLSSGPFCLNAYLITLEGAKKRMSCAFPARTPIDHYHFLPYRPRFMAVIPMLAHVNEQSAVKSMSSVNWSGFEKSARKYWWYYPLRDIVKLKALKKLLALRTTKFPSPGRWRSFESAFKVVPRRYYV
jgi:GR25 family glycosyltransferase involved in LPS biosynthesis